jgi:uncharacterized protein (TIGR03084 family)
VNVADNPGLAQAIDFRDECDALYAALATAPAEAWERPTQFKGWTFNDVLGHLHMFDHAAELAARGRAEIKSFLGEVAAGCADGTSLTDFTRRWLHGCNGAELLDRWRTQYRHLADVYLPLEPNLRLAWAGPDMSARSFMSARQMETWSHGQAVFDALGLNRVERDRMRNIAVMGVNTFGWTFTVNRRDVPERKPYVRLLAPSGAIWEWNDPAAADRVEGTAVDFCRVVTQTRNVRDTRLQVTGDVAQAWMDIAQCFAGPAEQPPAPGTRYRQHLSAVLG